MADEPVTWGSSARTRWEHVAEDLRARIERGEWSHDDLLPTEPELATEYNVSRDTVRQALLTLTSEGLLESSRGRGRRVRQYHRLEWWPAKFEHKGHRGDKEGRNLDAWAADVVEQGRTPEQRIEVSLVEASRLIAEQLEVKVGTTVARRARLRLVDGQPWQTADSHYPMWLAQMEDSLLLKPGDITVPGGFMAHLGHEQVWFNDFTIARMPNSEEIARLRLHRGTPIMEHVRTGYDTEDRPVRCIVTIAPGDRHVIRYRSEAQ